MLLGYSNSYSRGTYIQLPIEFQDRNAAYGRTKASELEAVTDARGTVGVLLPDIFRRYRARGELRSENRGNGVRRTWKREQIRGRRTELFQFRAARRHSLHAQSEDGRAAGFGRSYAINSGGANFATYCCQWPIGNNQATSSTTNYTQIFPLSEGPPAPQNVAVPSSGRLALPPGQMVFARPFDDKTTYQDGYNFTLQRQIGTNMTAEVGYVGALGRHLFRAHEVNPAVPGPGALTPRKPYGAVYGFNQSINERANEGNSHFNSLQTRLEKRFSAGLQFLASFTWQKTIIAQIRILSVGLRTTT